MKKLLILFILALAWPALGADYFVKNGGTAADKAAGTGPCTDASACMNYTVYAGETFSEGDTITFCKGPSIVPVIRGPHASVYTVPAAVVASYIQMVDGSSIILLVDGSSKLKRAEQ